MPLPFAPALLLALLAAPPAPRAYNLAPPVAWRDDEGTLLIRLEKPGGRAESFVVDRRTGERKAAPDREVAPPPPRERPRRGPGRVSARDHNLWLGDRPLTRDGTAADGYRGEAFPSPDGKRLVAYRTEAGGDRRVTLVESSPRNQLQPRVDTYPYLKPGDKIPLRRPHLFDLESGREIPVDRALCPNPWSLTNEHWASDGRTFYCVYNQRGHGTMRVLAIDAATGGVRAAVDEVCPTFFDYQAKLFCRHLDTTDELLWMSERSGWNHLYRIDRATGAASGSSTRRSGRSPSGPSVSRRGKTRRVHFRWRTR